jgi:phage terminase large subunit-like protein
MAQNHARRKRGDDVTQLAARSGPDVARQPHAPKQRQAEQVRRLDRAERVVRFIELLIVPSGKGAGKPFKLRGWQREFIYDIYAPHWRKTNLRVVRRAILSMARKNGKTALIAALALVHLIGPEAIQNGEVYSAANDREQAAQVFKMAAQMVRADPELMTKLRVIDSTKTIACYSNGSLYKAVSSEAGTKHGYNPTVVIYDELAQSRDRDLYDVLDTSFGARDEPLFVVISTQSNDPEHLLSKLIDDGLNSGDPTIVCHLYAVPEPDQPDDDNYFYDEELWPLANPALGDFRDYEDFKALALKAQRMPSEEPKFRNLYLNQRVSPVSVLINRVEWMACAGTVQFLQKERVYLALDLSSVNDLSALAMMSAGEQSKTRVYFWKPKELLKAHSDRDFGKDVQRYVEWERDGHLLASPGKTINPLVIAKKIAELSGIYTIVGLAYDRWRMKDLMREFETLQLPHWIDISTDEKRVTGEGLRLVEWGQGFKDMGPAVDAFEREVIDRTLVHDNCPPLNWCVGNAVAVMDPAGNRKLDKAKARFRIDGAQAVTMAAGLKARDLKKTPKKKFDVDGFLKSMVSA